jgi:outer membrane murein-binding lipoprotein Lpp
MRSGPQQILLAIATLATLVLAGCASTGQIEVLESRLRRQEDAANQLQSQLAESQSQLQAARREAVDLRTQLADGKRTARTEQLSALGTVEGISLNKYLTGGLDRDGVAGDEMLSAVVVPADADGNLVKAPGSVILTVLDLSKPEAQQQVGHWEYGPKDSESLWHSGFLGSGYVVRVPWQKIPDSPTLLVHARLKTIDGRQFDTSQSIRITPPAATAQAAVQPAPAPSQPSQQPAAPQPPPVSPASLNAAMNKPAVDTAVQQAGAKSSDEWWGDSKR